jgi:hypothetical protein
MGKLSDVIVPVGRMSLMYAETLVKDIKPADFARYAAGVKANHPAFCIGHLANYPERMLEFLGRQDVARPDQRFLDLFSAGKECRDDPDGSIYPSKDEIVGRFRERYQLVLGVLAETPDEVFFKPNPSPSKRFAEMLPTMGALASFLVGSHCQVHLGQLSTWRRFMGYGPAEM